MTMKANTPQIPFHMEMKFTHGESSQIWPNVRRVVAPNQGPLTHNGTNSYIIGQGSVAILDPGPDDKGHVEALLRATVGETVTHIFLTHRHKDHSGAIELLKQKTGAVTAAYPYQFDQALLQGGTDKPTENDYLDLAFKPDLMLDDDRVVRGENWQLKAIFTPGHAPDHLCFALEGEPIVFTGDHIMAWNTSVIIPPFGRMSDYLSSLRKLMGYECARYLPGHGGQARDPQRLTKAFLMHRRWRELAILDHIRDGKTNITEIVPLLYPKLTAPLRPAACLSVLAHLEHLVEQGEIVSCGDFGLEGVYRPVLK